MKPERIDFVPSASQQMEGHAARVKDWLEQHIPFINEYSAARLAAWQGGHISLSLYGYLQCEGAGPHGLQCETTLNINFDTSNQESFEDPNGDRWTRERLVAIAGWSSGWLRPVPARVKMDCIVKTVELAEAFDAAFGEDYFWIRGMTKAQRDQHAIDIRRDATRLKASAHIKEAIRTTCRLMRVGDMRFIPAPEGDLLPGDYDVEVANKTYGVTIRDESSYARFQFRRLK